MNSNIGRVSKENSAATRDKGEQAGTPPEGGFQCHRSHKSTEKLQDWQAAPAAGEKVPGRSHEGSERVKCCGNNFNPGRPQAD